MFGNVVWNLHGLKGNKIQTFKERNEPIVKKLSEKNDIICAAESWRDRYDPDILAWDDEFTEHSCLAKRDTKSGRSSGGTSLFIKNQTSRFGSIEKRDSYHVWYKLIKSSSLL